MTTDVDQLFVRHGVAGETTARHVVKIMWVSHSKLARFFETPTGMLWRFVLLRSTDSAIIVVNRDPVLSGAMAGFTRDARNWLEFAIRLFDSGVMAVDTDVASFD